MLPPGTWWLDGSRSFVPGIFAVRNMSRGPLLPRVPFILYNVRQAKGLIAALCKRETEASEGILFRATLWLLVAEPDSKDTRRAGGRADPAWDSPTVHGGSR